MAAEENLEAAVELGRNLNPVLLEDRFAVHADDVFADDDREAGQGRADRDGLPIASGHERGAQGAGHDGQAAFDRFLAAEPGAEVHLGEDAFIGIALAAVPAVSIPLDSQRVIADAQGRHLARTRGDVPKFSRVENLASPQGGEPGFTFAFASGIAKRAEAGFTRIASVGGAEGIVVFSPFKHNCRSRLVSMPGELPEQAAAKFGLQGYAAGTGTQGQIALDKRIEGSLMNESREWKAGRLRRAEDSRGCEEGRQTKTLHFPGCHEAVLLRRHSLWFKLCQLPRCNRRAIWRVVRAVSRLKRAAIGLGGPAPRFTTGATDKKPGFGW